jgi:DNA-binding transcriptional regulator PaaX
MKSSLSKTILKGLLLAGVIVIAAQSPIFISRIIQGMKKDGLNLGKGRKERKQFSNTFNRLKRQGLIVFETKGKQTYIRLSPEGKKQAGAQQIDELLIDTSPTWDGKWRILIFDIPEQTRIKREALRGKLKELGFVLLQKSVWVHAYPCRDELALLKNFFGFMDHDYIFLEVNSLGAHESALKRNFKV